MNTLRISINFLLLYCLFSCVNNLSDDALKCTTFDNHKEINKLITKLNPNDIDSVTVLFAPLALETSRIECCYTHPNDVSRKVHISDRLFLDSLKMSLETLKLNSNDSLYVSSDIYCQIFFHDGEKADLHLGTFFGTCYNGQKMQDEMQLQRMIKRKIGFYNYFNKNNLKSFRELKES